MDFNKMIDLPVVNISKGSRIGVVDDILIDRETQKVTFILVVTSKLFGIKKLLPIDQVQKISRYAVSILNEAGLMNFKKEEDLPFIRYKSDVLKKEVLSDTGKKIGHVDDGLFDMETGHIVEFTVSDGILQDLISGRKRIAEIDKILGEKS